MLHDVQSLADLEIARYVKKHPNVKMIVDCHADFSNSARNFMSKKLLHGVLWKQMAHILEPYTYKFYGVLPARVDFLTDMYSLPKNKCELLVMGADDELVAKAISKKKNNFIRHKYGISEEAFLVVTGGKIDMFKTQTLLLMEAVKRIDKENIILVVLGSVDNQLKGKFDQLVDNNKIIYAGWIDANDSYDYFAEADLVCFPGRHSVFWEQAAGLGVPLLVKYWEGTTHVDCGGNVEFLYKDSVNEIMNKILKIYSDDEYYKFMKNVAETIAMKRFSYSCIADQCLD